jgi:hypothetical protein
MAFVKDAIFFGFILSRNVGIVQELFQLYVAIFLSTEKADKKDFSRNFGTIWARVLWN